MGYAAKEKAENTVQNGKNLSDEEKKKLLRSQINFGSGTVKECEVPGMEGFTVEYRGGLRLALWWWKGRHHHNCYLQKEGTTFAAYSAARIDGRFFGLLRNCVQEMESGKYRSKKTGKELVMEQVCCRGLTSCMNNTKWREFREAMENEMPFPPPYIYKTVFEEESGEGFDFSEDVWYVGAYDIESFAGFNYKLIEWVKVRPRYYSYEGGRLVGRRVMHDAEREFVEIMEKYSIPYEVGDGVYVIYGYR